MTTDTFAADLKALVDDLGLTDMVLAGSSMGTGEVTRHLGTYGSGRVARAVLIGAIPPFLLKTDDNPEASTKGSSTDQGRGGRGGSIDPVTHDPWRLTLPLVEPAEVYWLRLGGAP